MSHDVVCDQGVVHAVCHCSGPHSTRKILNCKTDHEKEHRMSTAPTETVEELEARLAELKGVTPEDVAAQAQDEADGPGPLDHDHDAAGYDIQPAADPDDEDDDEDPDPTALTAFLVIVGPDGSAFATSELDKVAEIVPARVATVVDMRRACQEVVHDVNAMQISQQTVAIMQQSAAEMAEASRNAKIAAKLQSKGIHVPGRR